MKKIPMFSFAISPVLSEAVSREDVRIFREMICFGENVFFFRCPTFVFFVARRYRERSSVRRVIQSCPSRPLQRACVVPFA